MQVTREDISKTEVKLTVELTVEEMEPYVQSAAKRVAKEVEVKGFRKGKAPYEVLVKQVGEQALYQEAFNDVVEDTYTKAVDEQELQVVGQPEVNVEKLAPGNPLVYTITVPLMPQVVLGDYKKLKTKKNEPEMDDKRYEKTMNQIRQMRAQEKVVDRASKKGDKVIADFQIKVDNVAIEGGSGTKQELMLEDGNFVDDFMNGIIGMKKGEENDFDMTFPKEYHKKDLQNKEGKVHVKVHDVYEITLPELTDEVAKEMNFESLAKMEEEMKANIMRELEGESQHEFENAVIKEIVELSEIDELPSQLVQEEISKMLAELRQNVQQQGASFEEYLSHVKKTEDELREDFKERAVERLQAAIVLRELSVAEKIKVNTEDVDKEIEALRATYKDAPNILQELDSPYHRTRMENEMMHKKLFEKLAEYAA
jgi:trigger factor